MSADFARTYTVSDPPSLKAFQVMLSDAADELAACKQLLRRLAEVWRLSSDGTEMACVVADCHGVDITVARVPVSPELAALFKEVTA